MVKINTDAVRGLAEKISNGNNSIQTAFDIAVNAANALPNSWSGAASGHANASFAAIRDKYYSARYQGIKNYANILKGQMAGGYEETENSNISLADQFK